MQRISNYHRPSDLAEALALLGRSDVPTSVIAGGTVIAAAALAEPTEVVDIQRAVSSEIGSSGDRVEFGAMARLQDVVDHEATPPLLANLARREGPNTLRNASTIGGTVAEASGESELLAGLLVHDAAVTVVRAEETKQVALAELLADLTILDGGIVTAVSVAMGGETASARTGRTPADVPIVAVAGRVVGDGVMVAATGVAATPVLVEPDGSSELDPPSDFRGSTEYRRELAGILTERVVEQLGGAA